MSDRIGGRIVILGVGNTLMSDEGLGVHVARLLFEKLLPPGVEVIEGGINPIEMLGECSNIEKLVVVDAVEADEPSGAVYRLPAEVLADGQTPLSLHQFTLAQTLAEWRLQGLGSERIVIIGVQPHSLGWGTELSSEIASSLPAIAEAVLVEANATEGRRA